jgi:SpoIID/LytB domain protein
MISRALRITLAISLVAMVASPAIADDRDVYTFEGRGWGHSVGLSQYGARGMAMEGYGYQEIVTHYYKGTSVGTIADTVASDSFLRTKNRPVWVGLLQSIKSTTFSPYVVEDGHTVQVCQNKLSTGRRCANAKAGQEWKVRVADKGGCRVLRNDNRVWETRGKCRVDVTWDEAPTRILLSGTGYTYARGVLHVRPVPGKDAFHVSIQLSMDEYIRGIAEVPTAWPTATLKAQAVAARSYAAYKVLGYGPISSLDSIRLTECWCHLYGDTRDQYYIGWAKETYGAAWPDAVTSTSGKVVTYGGGGTQSGIIQAFYSASSGGVTERSVDIWGGWRDYLQSVSDPWAIDPAVGNPYATWNFDLTAGKLASALGWDEVASVTLLTVPPNSTFQVKGTEGGEAVSTTVTGPWIYQTFGTRSPHLRGVTKTAALPFDDISTGDTHTEAILAIHDAGITAGCDSDSFCPDATVTRAQMASFLARALDLEPAEDNRFRDVTSGSTHAGAINAIADAGITLGCNKAGTRFCPEQAVTRAQMASFLARALGLDPIGGRQFSDVPADSVHLGAINAIAAAGITKGCDSAGTSFCPEKALPRAEMASFLARSFVWE